MLGVDEDRDGGVVEDAHNEPTMGDKFESLHLLEGEKQSSKDSAPVDDKPPTAASVNVLLRQALHADDRSLLLDCLYNRDEQVSERCFFNLFFALGFSLLLSYSCVCMLLIGDC